MASDKKSLFKLTQNHENFVLFYQTESYENIEQESAQIFDTHWQFSMIIKKKYFVPPRLRSAW